MTIRKLLLGTVAAVLLTISPAAAKDVMVALMDNGRGAQEVHYQLVEHESCLTVRSALKTLQKQHQKMQLTFVDPPFSGYVLEASCILPDGTVIGEKK
jgi:hypothetical protein